MLCSYPEELQAIFKYLLVVCTFESMAVLCVSKHRQHPGLAVFDALYQQFSVPVALHQVAHVLSNKSVFTGIFLAKNRVFHLS